MNDTKRRNQRGEPDWLDLLSKVIDPCSRLLMICRVFLEQLLNLMDYLVHFSLGPHLHCVLFLVLSLPLLCFDWCCWPLHVLFLPRYNLLHEFCPLHYLRLSWNLLFLELASQCRPWFFLWWFVTLFSAIITSFSSFCSLFGFFVGGDHVDGDEVVHCNGRSIIHRPS